MGDSKAEKKDLSNSELYELLNKKIEAKFSELTLQISQANANLTQELLAAKQTALQLKEENELLAKKVALLEKKIRRNNIAVFGLKRDENNLLDSWIGQLSSLLKIDIALSDLSQVFQPKNSPQAPVVFELLSGFKKREIFDRIRDNLDSLKAAKVFVTNDLSREEQEVLKALKKKRALARAEGREARIVGRSIVIDGVKTSYEDIIGAKRSEIEEASQGTECNSDDFDDIPENSAGGVTGSQSRDSEFRNEKRKLTTTPSPRARTTRSNKKKKH